MVGEEERLKERGSRKREKGTKESIEYEEKGGIGKGEERSRGGRETWSREKCERLRFFCNGTPWPRCLH